MSDHVGTFIVIEGADGSGKTTQLELLRNRLVTAGYDVTTISFPRYEEQSSYFVRQYLSGSYGSVNDTSPYTASLFYALDRYQAAPKIREALQQNKIVLADRYVGSNMAHQGTKFRNAEERRGYFIWLDNLEFEMLGIPRPTMSFVLRMPTELSAQLLQERDQAGQLRDIHEKDQQHLRRTLGVFDDMCQLFPKDFTRIDCARDKQLLTPSDIEGIIWGKVEPYLPNPSRHQTHEGSTATEIIADNPYIHRNEQGIYEVTTLGKTFLESVVTNATEDVYTFTDKLTPLIIAAAMAQRTKRVDDLRLTLLEEYAGKLPEHQEQEALNVTRNNPATKRLTGLHLVIENASSLLAQIFDHSRLATSLDLSSPYTYLDTRDSKGSYAYYVPPELDEATQQHYRRHMDQIFDQYSDIIQKLVTYIGENSVVPAAKRTDIWSLAVRKEACQTAAVVLPVATTATVGIFAPLEPLEDLVRRLFSSELTEAQSVGRRLLVEIQKIVPSFLDSREGQEPINGSVAYETARQEALRHLTSSSQNHADSNQEAIQLNEIWPRNEFDVLPAMLYEVNNLSLSELDTMVSSWPFEKKLQAFRAYMGQRQSRRDLPGPALGKVRYGWDILCAYSVFRQLSRYIVLSDTVWQSLTPRYGYDMPKLIEDAGVEEEFEACFATSLKLFSLLQEKGFTTQAQYATLLGHKLRWQLNHNGQEAFHIFEQPLNHTDDSRQLVDQMYRKIAEKHPNVAEAMKFTAS
ncbi:MAG TPA: FAD-dependent thymidylate synthase [Candidatus Saccharimonadales bacterium]|nr:FAD-dependent thymidylate synthase [Candidatus Saccharimonadales bacterium]